MTKLESGRSMVEMLGVLAIIGVLSIGGIAGYTMAMNRNTANNLTDAAAKLSVLAYARGQSANPVATLGYNAAGLGTSNDILNNMTANTSTGVVTLTGYEDDGVVDILKQQLGDSAVNATSKDITFDFKNN